jgi:beta-mannosidase
LAAREIVLVFDGLDTVADVVVNGVTVGSSDNMFVRYVFHVKSVLKVSFSGFQRIRFHVT